MLCLCVSTHSAFSSRNNLKTMRPGTIRTMADAGVVRRIPAEDRDNLSLQRWDWLYYSALTTG